MGDQKFRQTWSWTVPTEPPGNNQNDETFFPKKFGNLKAADSSKQVPADIVNRVVKLKESLTRARDECSELRQDASDLQEYSNAKVARVTRYLGVLAEKARKLDHAASDSEDRITPLKRERKKLFNDLITIKGNIRVYIRVRPQFENEGPMATSFPDDYTIRVNPVISGSTAISPARKEFEFDRVYGPHIGQESFFHDVQPLVQSALDGYNVSIFAYGHTGAGKTHTMEGLIHDRGLYFRAFEELYDISNGDSRPTSTYSFFLTIMELHNEQVCDLLNTSSNANVQTVRMGIPGHFVELVQQRIDSPAEFARVFKISSQNRFADAAKAVRSSRSHLILTLHIYYSNTLSGEKQYSKLSMVDMAGSERLSETEARGDRLTESLHVNKSLSALGDVVSSLTAKKERVPYGNSRLTQLLADSLGGDSKTLIIVNVSPSYKDVQETLSSLNFATRARNVELSIGNRDTIKKWRDMANDARKELYEKEKIASELKQELLNCKKSLKDADDQCLMLFNEVQKAWKVAFDLQTDLDSQNSQISKLQADWTESTEKYKLEIDRNNVLNTQIMQLSKLEKEYKAELSLSAEKIKSLEGKLQDANRQLAEAKTVRLRKEDKISSLPNATFEFKKAKEDYETALSLNKKLEEELSKRDELIERLHEENEKLFGRLTDKTASIGSPKTSRTDSKGTEEVGYDSSRDKRKSMADPVSGGSALSGTLAVVGSEKVKSTPAGEYLTAALMDFNPDQYDSAAAIADGANKLLMLVLAAVIKAGAAREHEMLAEIRVSVFSFIRKMEPLRVMDTMLVSRVRILYIRSLLSRSSELQGLKVPRVEQFLERGGWAHNRTSSRGESPPRSPSGYDLSTRDFEERIKPFKVNLKQEKKSKLSAVVLKLRGIDQETWRQHTTGAKLRETSEDAKNYAVGNKMLASLFVHTPAGELQRQIRTWLAENFDFLSLTGGDGNALETGHLELLSTAIMDGWMAGLGTPSQTSTDALGQLLSDYTKRVYTSQLQHLKDLSATLATEEADDLAQVTKLRSALESVEHKRRKVLQQMRTDVGLLTKEEGGSPLRNPPTATEDARVASLISLEDILKQAEDIVHEADEKSVSSARKRALLSRLNQLNDKMPTLLAVDQPCAEKYIMEIQEFVETLAEQETQNSSLSRMSTEEIPVPSELSTSSGDWGEGILNADVSVHQWSVLQFNNGAATPFVIKCGATPTLQLVVRAQTNVNDKNSKERVATVPVPSALAGLSLDEIKDLLSPLPEALCQLALARTADGTRARYARLYKTLAVRVPALRTTVDKVTSSSASSQKSAQLRKKSDAESF